MIGSILYRGIGQAISPDYQEMNMKKTLIASALAVAAFNASAAGLGAGIVIGGGATGFAGAVSGNAYSNSTGSAVAASQVNGAGSSFQHTDGFNSGTATIGGVVNHNGAQVVTNTTQVAQISWRASGRN